MLLFQAFLLLPSSLGLTGAAPAEHHAQVVRRQASGYASTSLASVLVTSTATVTETATTTSTHVAVVGASTLSTPLSSPTVATVSNTHTTPTPTPSGANATTTATTNPSWLNIWPDQQHNTDADIAFTAFTLFKDSITDPIHAKRIVVIANHNACMTLTAEGFLGGAWDKQADGFFFHKLEAEKAACALYTDSKCQGSGWGLGHYSATPITLSDPFVHNVSSLLCTWQTGAKEKYTGLN